MTIAERTPRVDRFAALAQDARLAPGAIAVWLAALLGLLVAWWLTVVLGALAICLGGYRWRRDRGRRPVGAAAGLVLCGILAICPLAIRLAVVEYDDLRAAAEHGGTATMAVTVAERPRPMRADGFGDRPTGPRSVLISAKARSVAVDGAAVRSTGTVLLIGPYETWSRILPGQRLSATGTLAPARPGEMTVAVLYLRGPPAAVEPAPWWEVQAETIRAALRASCEVLDEDAGGLVPGLVVGDTSGLPGRVEQEFRDSGLSHLTAVSGTNVAIICGAILLLLRACRVGPRVASVIAGMALAGFVVLVGPEPSVLRAGVMGAVALLALAFGRRRSALAALAVAIAGLIVYDPAMAVSFGFALSVVATGALVLLAPRWAAALTARGVPPGFAECLAVPFAAVVATTPIIAGMAGEISLVAVLANLLAAPVVAPVTIFGVLAAVFAPWWAGAAEVMVHIAGPEADWLVFVAREAAGIPGAVIGWPAGWWGGALAAVVAVVVLVAVRVRAVRSVSALLLVAVVVVVVPTSVIAPGWPPPGWAMTMCDVGQGDGLALPTTEPGRAVVVDTGPEPGAMDGCLDRLDIERVPLVVLSHLHADHIGGLRSVFDGRSVGAVAVGPGRKPAWAWRQVASMAAEHRVPLLELEVGERLDWPGLSIEVLGPDYVAPQGDSEQDGTRINNTSVVLAARTAAGRVLLTGDVELAAQSDLIAAGVDLRADILKVPHHGSRYSLPQFLDAVEPRLAVVSVGQGNTYGHPNATTMNLLSHKGTVIARTDVDGDAAVIPDVAGPAVVRRGKARRADRRARSPAPADPAGISRRGPCAPRRPRAARSRSGRPCPRWRRAS